MEIDVLIKLIVLVPQNKCRCTARPACALEGNAVTDCSEWCHVFPGAREARGVSHRVPALGEEVPQIAVPV